MHTQDLCGSQRGILEHAECVVSREAQGTDEDWRKSAYDMWEGVGLFLFGLTHGWNEL